MKTTSIEALKTSALLLSVVHFSPGMLSLPRLSARRLLHHHFNLPSHSDILIWCETLSRHEFTAIYHLLHTYPQEVKSCPILTHMHTPFSKCSNLFFPTVTLNLLPIIIVTPDHSLKIYGRNINPIIYCKVLVWQIHKVAVLTKKWRVKSDTKLPNEVTGFLLCTGITELRQELTCTRLGNCAEISDEVILRHADASVSHVQNVIVFISLQIYQTQSHNS